MMNKSSWSNWVDKPSDYCTHLMTESNSLNQISSDQIKLNKSNGSNNDEQLESFKLRLLHQVNQNQLSRQS